MTSTFEGWRIEYVTNADDLFEGYIGDEPLETIDMPASAERFTALLEAKLREEYPGAEIEVGGFGSPQLHVYLPDGDGDGREESIEVDYIGGQLASAILHDCAAWFVYKEEAV